MMRIWAVREKSKSARRNSRDPKVKTLALQSYFEELAAAERFAPFREDNKHAQELQAQGKKRRYQLLKR